MVVATAVIFVPMLFEDESLVPPYAQGPFPTEPDFKGVSTPNTSDTMAETPSALPEAPGLSDEEARLEPTDPMQRLDVEEASAVEDDSPEGVFDAVQEPAPPTVAPPPIARAAPPRTQVQTVKQPVPSSKPAQPPKPLQPPPAKTEAAASLPAPPKSRADGLPSWVVQVSSLGSPEAAGKLADKLKQAGFSAFVERAEVGGKTYYRVRVGPDIDRANAERTAAMLRKQQKLDTLIQRYQ